jgi:EmrB/QacA subfamily drug resistance transporter
MTTLSATTTSPTAAEPSASGIADALDPNRWAALAVLLTGAFLAPLDFFIVNVALPSITAGLGARPADVQLVISGYAVVFAVFLITGGRLGDMFGRKSIFLFGLSGFALASAFCGLAWSPLTLILARLLQAFTAAAMAPQALASIHALFPANERGRALGLYGMTIGLASVIGQLLGGVLVGADIDGLGWRLIFLINLPIAAVTFIAALPLLRQTRGAIGRRLDFGGIVLSSAALSSFTVPLVEGRERGWPWWSIVMLLTTPIFVDLFRRYESRLASNGGDPLVAFEVFRSPGLLRGLSAIMTLYAISTFFLVYSIYLQTALGFTALQAGLEILPFSAGVLTGSAASPYVGRGMGQAAPSFGFVLSAAGAVALSLVTTDSPPGLIPPLALMVPALLFIGLGIGMSVPTMVRVIVERAEPHHAGLIGGMVNSTLQVSSAVGIAVLGGLFYNALGIRTDPLSVTHAFAVTLLAIAACHIAGAVLAAGLGQRRAVSRQCIA